MNLRVEIRDQVLNVMKENGFSVDVHNMEEELFYDSLQFVSLMVSIEDMFRIAIPERYLLAEGLNTANDFCVMVSTLIDEKGGEIWYEDEEDEEDEEA